MGMSGYDMIPWKLVFCGLTEEKCEDNPAPKLMIRDLPDAPEPGRIPNGADHVHIAPKLSADQRNARGDLVWRTLLLCVTRCQHGRVQGDRCYDCPGGWAPSKAGERFGYYIDGLEMIIPPREKHNDIEAWRGERWRG